MVLETAHTFWRGTSRTLGLLFVLLTTVFCTQVRARAEIAIPKLSSPVIDSGEFFTAQEREQLSRKLIELDAAGPQVQIWTVQSLEGEPIESISLRAAETWKLGNVEKDDGLLLMLARKERRFRLEVGQGLEGVIPDITASRMLRKYLVPSLRSGDAAAGVSAIIDAIAALTGHSTNGDDTTLSPRKKPSLFSQLAFYLIFLIALVVLNLAKAAGERTFRRHHPYGSWGRRGGGWGGGSWGGGGGGFSGGGSSGGW